MQEMTDTNNSTATVNNTETETSAGATELTTAISDNEVETVVETTVESVSKVDSLSSDLSKETAADDSVINDDTIAATSVDVTKESIVPAVPVALNLRKQILKQYAIALGVILVMGISLWYMMEEQGRIKTGLFDNIKEMVVPPPAAAVVNDIRVPLSIYEKNFNSFAGQATSQGIDLSDPAVAESVKKQALDVVINTALLESAAKAGGITVTTEQIEERYQEIAASQGGVEKLAERMVELGITEEGLREDIRQEILIQTHLESAVDASGVVVSEEEILALYNSVASNPEAKVPPLAEVRAQIEQEVRFGKEQELVGAYLEKLKTDAKIEILI